MKPRTQKLLIFGIIALGAGITIPALASNTLVDSTSVSTTTVNAVNVVSSNNVNASNAINTKNLVVTGTCTGCGGGGAIEGNYNTWNSVLNTTTSGHYDNVVSQIFITNTGVVMFHGDFNNDIVYLNGTSIYPTSWNNAGSGIDIAQSLTGEYQVLINGNGTYVPTIIKNNQIVQKLGINVTQFLNNFGYKISAIGISPNGKYIGIVGIDSGGSVERVLVFQGS